MVMMAMSREGQEKMTMSPKVPININKQSTVTVGNPERYKAAPVSISKDEDEAGYDQDEFNDEEIKVEDHKPQDGFFLTGQDDNAEPKPVVKKQKTNRASKKQDQVRKSKQLEEIDDVYNENPHNKTKD